MLYVTKHQERWGVLIFGYLALTLLAQCVQLIGSTSCLDQCRCLGIANDPGTDAVTSYHVRCWGVIEDISRLTLPSDVAFLDLSATALHTIPPYHFMDRDLKKIVELDLSGNNITHIWPDIFVGLNDLRILNLNYNKILYFDPHSLIYNDFLTHLGLKGTHLPVSDNSLVISRSLEVLDLSECGITMLHNLTLSEIPYLKILNVSKNPLSSIDPKVLDNLKWLKQLDITRTYIRCDHSLAALSEWGKASSVAIIGYPCLNSHSLQGHSFRNYRRRTTVPENALEWPTPIPVMDESILDNESKERLELDATNGVAKSMDFVMDDDSSEAFSEESEEEADEGSEEEPDEGSEEESDSSNEIIRSPGEDTVINDTKDGLSESLAKVHWTIWLACAGGFGLGVALTIGLGFAAYVCCCRQPEDPNELVSAGEDFQLVQTPVEAGPIIRDEPPSYSSLFSSRYHKVLPTAAVHRNRVVR